MKLLLMILASMMAICTPLLMVWSFNWKWADTVRGAWALWIGIFVWLVIAVGLFWLAPHV